MGGVLHRNNTLAVSTTHIKTGWLLRNGAPTSDLATMSESFTRCGYRGELRARADRR